MEEARRMDTRRDIGGPGEVGRVSQLRRWLWQTANQIPFSPKSPDDVGYNNASPS